MSIGGDAPQTACTHGGAAPDVVYSCTYTVQGTETSGGTPVSQLAQAAMPVVVTATDEVGNTGTAPAAGDV